MTSSAGGRLLAPRRPKVRPDPLDRGALAAKPIDRLAAESCFEKSLRFHTRLPRHGSAQL